MTVTEALKRLTVDFLKKKNKEKRCISVALEKSAGRGQ